MACVGKGFFFFSMLFVFGRVGWRSVLNRIGYYTINSESSDNEGTFKLHMAIKCLLKGTINRTGWKEISKHGVSDLDGVLVEIQNEMYRFALSHEGIRNVFKQNSVPLIHQDGVLLMIMDLVEASTDFDLNIELDAKLLEMADRCSERGEWHDKLAELQKELLNRVVYQDMSNAMAYATSHFRVTTLLYSLFGSIPQAFQSQFDSIQGFMDASDPSRIEDMKRDLEERIVGMEG